MVYRIEIVDSRTEVLWERTFSGEETVDSLNLFKSEFEEVFNKAYCNALSTFAEAVKSDDFKQAIQKK